MVFANARKEVDLIAKYGRKDLGTGTLYNRTPGGEVQSGGIDLYGYRQNGIARWITDMVDKGINIKDIPSELLKRIEKSGLTFKSTIDRIISHLKEMSNSGCHYKGPRQYLLGWQFSLNGKAIDINTITLETVGFLKVHGDKPWNDGTVTPM